MRLRTAESTVHMIVHMDWSFATLDAKLHKISSYGDFTNFGGIVDSESALRSAEIILSRVHPATVLWSDGRPKSLRSSCNGQAIKK
ncbi:hypothetical protein PoB_004648200 [Plakobranchus ocellatus]|uniref:Uncharacterized protein n=1 Tax=Plakobranchus ocellatus TaxID=259542 RepID=A0AAV4BKR3_9GAST|nr:hypothetical protein PoB_004648200 [Plakobranchus ocellatus]